MTIEANGRRKLVPVEDLPKLDPPEEPSSSLDFVADLFPWILILFVACAVLGLSVAFALLSLFEAWGG